MKPAETLGLGCTIGCYHQNYTPVAWGHLPVRGESRVLTGLDRSVRTLG